MRRTYEIERQIDIVDGDESAISSYFFNGTIETYNDRYGDDADGNRGEDVIYSDLREYKISDENGFDILDKQIEDKVLAIWNKFYSYKDFEKAEREHSEDH